MPTGWAHGVHPDQMVQGVVFWGLVPQTRVLRADDLPAVPLSLILRLYLSENPLPTDAVIADLRRQLCVH